MAALGNWDLKQHMQTFDSPCVSTVNDGKLGSREGAWRKKKTTNKAEECLYKYFWRPLWLLDWAHESYELFSFQLPSWSSRCFQAFVACFIA